MKPLKLLVQTWQQRENLGDSRSHRELAAFLPAALEIQETPPNPITRWVAWSLLTLLMLFLLWALYGEINIVASAEGKIIPSSRVKQIQPLTKAVVKNILVSEGEAVSKGQALIELDSTLTLADKKRLSGEINSLQLQLAVSRALLAMLEDSLAEDSLAAISLGTIPTATVQEMRLYQKVLQQQWQQYRAQLQTLHSSRRKTVAEQAMTREIIKKLEKILPIITRRTATMQDLYRKKFATETDYLQLEQEHIQHTQDLAAEKQHMQQLAAAQQEIQHQIEAFSAQTRSAQLTAISEAQRQIESLSEELTKADDLNARQTLYSPVSGRVQALSINTIGGIVTEAQQLMLIVPDEEQLEVEVALENKDIGFVREAMQAEIKIHTFPFTRYGVIDADVLSVSNDATVDEKRGLIFGMQLRLHKNSLLVNGQIVKLIPGMAVTAEVQTGKRRIIEFFLAPLLKAGAESIRER